MMDASSTGKPVQRTPRKGPGWPTLRGAKADAVPDQADIRLMKHLGSLSAEVLSALRVELLRLAAREDDRAATEASRVPYWEACPPSVSGHRAAATILREDAASLDIVA